MNPKLTEVEHIATAWTIHRTPNVHAGALFFVSAVISDSPILLHQQPAMPPIWTANPTRGTTKKAPRVCVSASVGMRCEAIAIRRHVNRPKFSIQNSRRDEPVKKTLNAHMFWPNHRTPLHYFLRVLVGRTELPLS